MRPGEALERGEERRAGTRGSSRRRAGRRRAPAGSPAGSPPAARARRGGRWRSGRGRSSSSRYFMIGPKQTHARDQRHEQPRDALAQEAARRRAPAASAAIDQPASRKKSGMCQRPMKPATTSMPIDSSALRMWKNGAGSKTLARVEDEEQPGGARCGASRCRDGERCGRSWCHSFASARTTKCTAVARATASSTLLRAAGPSGGGRPRTRTSRAPAAPRPRTSGTGRDAAGGGCGPRGSCASSVDQPAARALEPERGQLRPVEGGAVDQLHPTPVRATACRTARPRSPRARRGRPRTRVRASAAVERRRRLLADRAPRARSSQRRARRRRRHGQRQRRDRPRRRRRSGTTRSKSASLLSTSR